MPAQLRPTQVVTQNGGGCSGGGGGGVAVAVGSNFISALHSGPFTLLLRRVKPASFPTDDDDDDDDGSEHGSNADAKDASTEERQRANEAKLAKKGAKAAVMASSRMIAARAMGEGAAVVYGAAAAGLLPDAIYDIGFFDGLPSTPQPVPHSDSEELPGRGIGSLDAAQAAAAAVSMDGAAPIAVDARAVMAVDGALVTQGGGRSVFGGPPSSVSEHTPKSAKKGGATKRAKAEAAATAAAGGAESASGQGGVALSVRVRTSRSAFVGGIVGCMEIGQPQLRALIVNESLALLRPSPATAPTLKEALIRALPDDMFVLLHPVARLTPPFLATLHHGSFCALPNSASNSPDDEAQCMVSLVPNPLQRFCLPLDSSVDVVRVFEGDKRLARLSRRSGAYRVTCNVEPRRCLLAVRDYHIKVHEKTWLLMPLIESLVALADKAREAVAAGKALPSKVCVFALWGPASAASAAACCAPDASGGGGVEQEQPAALLAVTVGLWAGRAYHDVTMATLVRDKRSLGHCLSLKQAALLRRAGCDLWYWGVELGYMSTYRAHGATTLDRMAFLALWDSLAAKPRNESECAVEVSLGLPAGIDLAPATQAAV